MMKYKYIDIKDSFKNGGSIISRLFMNRISMPFIYCFANFTKVTPNQITLIGFTFGLCAALSFYKSAFILGAMLFEISYLFDCIDGRLARLTGQTTKTGDMYDHILGQFIVLILILPLICHNFLLARPFQLFLLVVFLFLSPFNYFVNYFSKYTFSQVYSTSLITDKNKGNSPFKKVHLFLKGKGMRSTPSDVEAIHLVFVIVPLVFANYKLANVFIMLAILIFLFDIVLAIYRNIQLNKLESKS